jgi:hypothetical protein
MDDLDNELEVSTQEAEVQETQEVPDIKQIMEDAKKPPQEEQEKKFDPKKDKVEFSTPEQLARFKAIEAQRNASDNRNKMYWDIIQKQQERLDALEGRLSQEDHAIAEKTILDKLQQANDEGDTAAIAKAVDELVKFRTASEKKPEKTTQKVNETPIEQSPDFQYVAELAAETDENGNPLRPWLLDGGQNEPQLIKRSEEIAAELYAKNPNDPYIVAKVFKQLDKEMMAKPKAKPQTRVPDPMQGSNLTQQQQRGAIKLSDKEREIARKLGVDPKRYFERKMEIQRAGER